MQMLTIVFRSIFKERGQELLHRCEVKAWCEEAANHFIPAGRGLPFASSAGPVPGLFRAQGGSLPPIRLWGNLVGSVAILLQDQSKGQESFGRKQHEISTYRMIQVQSAMASRLL
jgi:hypothetical protein